MGKANSSCQFPKSTTDNSGGCHWNATKALLTLGLLAAIAPKYGHTLPSAVTHSPVLQILESLAQMLSPEKTRSHFWSLLMFPAYLGSEPPNSNSKYKIYNSPCTPATRPDWHLQNHQSQPQYYQENSIQVLVRTKTQTKVMHSHWK